MSKVLLAILFLCLPILVLAQTSATTSGYQPATIIAVNPHPSAGNSNPDDALYEVSVKVNRTTLCCRDEVSTTIGNDPVCSWP